MKKIKLLILPFIFLSSFTFSSCNKSIPVSETGGLSFVSLANNSSLSYVNETTNLPMLEYSKNGRDWNRFKPHELIIANQNEKIFLRGDNLNGFSLSSTQYSHFITKGSFNVYGNIMSIIDYGSLVTDTIPIHHCFYRLFQNCNAIKDASELILPCTNLTEYCYDEMFMNCQNLIEGPELPATTLQRGCYHSFLKGCTSLIYPPDLPAPKLEWECYNHLFDGCNKLKYLCVNFTEFLFDPEESGPSREDLHSTFCWVDNVYGSGLFVCPKALSDKKYSQNQSRIPFGWTIVPF